MFDIGFWELGLILVVALLVIGPDRLPSAAATAGRWIGRMRRFISSVKEDIDREIRQEEIKKALERDAGLDEIKEIMNKPIMDTDRFLMEDEEPEKNYQVKAIPDDVEKQTDQEAKADDTAPDAKEQDNGRAKSE